MKELPIKIYCYNCHAWSDLIYIPPGMYQCKECSIVLALEKELKETDGLAPKTFGWEGEL